METPLADLLGLPEYPFDVFERSPLVLVLCQVRFAPVLGVADPAFVAPFQRAIRDRYPLATPGEEVTLELNVAAGATQIKPESQRRRRWQFTDETEGWTVVLADDFLTIESRAYRRFSEFLDRLSGVVEALVAHVQPTIGLRLGLRCINEIRAGGLTWAEIVRPELLGPLVAPELKQHAQQLSSQLILRYQNEQGINVNHGLFPSGTTVRPRPGQKPPAEPFYLLDFDAYRTFPLPSGLELDPEQICARVEQYNRAIYRLFRWSITEQYTATLGVHNDGGN